jgi:hypothetical protein
MLTEADIRKIRPVRYPRRVTDDRGLYLLVQPTGTLCWRFSYRFGGKKKTLCLGTHPIVTLAWARSRHTFVRHLLAHGVDPVAMKNAVGKAVFRVTMREWEIEERRRRGLSDLPYEQPMALA